jgi:hypothetical protein
VNLFFPRVSHFMAIPHTNSVKNITKLPSSATKASWKDSQYHDFSPIRLKF